MAAKGTKAAKYRPDNRGIKKKFGATKGSIKDSTIKSGKGKFNGSKKDSGSHYDEESIMDSSQRHHSPM